MAEGGSNGEESHSKEFLAVQKLFDKLVDKCKVRVRDLIERFSIENMITELQKKTALESHHNNERKAANVTFSGVLRTVARDDSVFNCLVKILRDEGYGDLANELCEAVLSPVPTNPPCKYLESNNPEKCTSKLKRGASWHGGISKEASPPPKSDVTYKSEELDSGIASRRQTGLQAQLASNSEPHLEELVHGHIVQPKLLSASLEILSRKQTDKDYSQNSASNVTDSVEESASAYLQTVNETSPPPTTTDNLQLVTPVQVNEPRSYDIEQHQAPVQIAALDPNPPNDMILVPEGDRMLTEGDMTEDDLREDLRNMRHEVQQMKAQGMQKEAENVDLQDKCRELEEKVEKTSEDLRVQKEHTEYILKEKDDAIKEWKKLYDEKVGEVEELRSEIANKEKEQDEMLKLHEEKINELQNEHKKTVKDHQDKILSLQKELEETKQKKVEAEIQLAHAKEQLSQANLQKVQEELKAKEMMHKFVLETMTLKVSLSKTKEELADERRAKYERELRERERELHDHRRQSVQIENNFQQQLQDRDSEIVELKRLLSQKSNTSDSSGN